MAPVGGGRVMTVEVRYLGHLGNNLFQYALGRIIAEHLGQALRCVPATDMPGWSAVERDAGIGDRLSDCVEAFADAPQRLAGAAGNGPALRYVLGERPGWSGHGIDLEYLLRAGAGRPIVLKGYFQRSEYYQPHAERIRHWLRWAGAPAGPTLAADDVVVHLRQSLDMFVLDRAIDLAFYRDTLAAMSPARVYVCGLGLGPAVQSALAQFKPSYLDLPAIPTLGLLTRARRIVLANSTFSWWGAYLSRADEVVFPCLTRGYWSHERPDVALAVPEDRYRYVSDVGVQVWRPFAPAADVRFTVEEHSADKLLLIAHGRRQRPLAFPLRAALLPIATWLCARRDPFGLTDLDAAELTDMPRVHLVQFLLALCRNAVLDAAPGATRALSGFFGLAE